MNLTAILAILAIAGPALNVYLLVRIRNEILQSERRMMDYVEGRYRLEAVCQAEMAAVARRLETLESRCPLRPAGEAA
jgi:hypothetical protein